VHSEPLAKSLWSVNAQGKTWEYVYFLDELQEIEIPIKRFNEVLGYKPKNVVQGFNVLEGKKADAVAELIDYDYRLTTVNGHADNANDLINQLAKLHATDLPIIAKTRAEAEILRRHLFGVNSTSQCDLCGRRLPVRLIVTAHIKARASCTDDERRDLKVVMRACRLGCDELFERGYITVRDDGQISATANLDLSPTDLKTFAESLVGSTCKAFSAATAPYFDWHGKHLRRYLK
jgi:hypothetical protein